MTGSSAGVSSSTGGGVGVLLVGGGLGVFGSSSFTASLADDACCLSAGNDAMN